MNEMIQNWFADVKVCIDERMIKYLGGSKYCQYMLLKPIAHRIKVSIFTFESHCLGWKTYLGKKLGRE